MASLINISYMVHLPFFLYRSEVAIYEKRDSLHGITQLTMTTYPKDDRGDGKANNVDADYV